MPKETKPFIYCDYSATTPLSPSVQRAMQEVWDKWGNPSALHTRGQQAAGVLEQARLRCAQVLHCEPYEVIFTSGGTESDNLALKGVEILGKPYGEKRRGHILASGVEHSAVRQTLEYLSQHGFAVGTVPVDKWGRVDPAEVAKRIEPDTLLVTIMYANNEVGTVQPISEISKICRARKILFHTDAVQAPGYLSLDVQELGVDLLSLSAHKFHGPQGVGLLYVRKGVRLQPQNLGGGQERGLRGATENLPGIVGMSVALEIAEKKREKESARLSKLATYFRESILAKIPNVYATNRSQNSLPGLVHLCFAGIEGESILLRLDAVGVAVSTGSACASHRLEPSHVLQAMGIPVVVAHGGIRFSFGDTTTKKDIDYLLKVLPPIISELRELSPVYHTNILKQFFHD